MTDLERRRVGGRIRTGWPRSRPARAVRGLIQLTMLRPVVRAELTVEAHGTEFLAGELATVAPPALIVANHASHLDAAVLIDTLPPAWRERTAVATAADSFSDRWRATGSALVFNTFATHRGAGLDDSSAAELLAAGWAVLAFPEETRSPDGFPRPFHPSVASLAIAERVPVIPVGLRGTYAVMPRGARWPVPGRPRVSVRYGAPLTAGPQESAEAFTCRLQDAVRRLVAEDQTSWWAVRRHPARCVEDPPPATWRRIWQQSEEPTVGGRPRRPRIWRQ